MGAHLMSELTFPVPKHFKDKFPDKPDAWYNKYHMKYLTVLAKYTIKPYLSVNGKVPINLPLKKMQDEMGSFQYNNERFYVWREFGEGAGYIQVIRKGNNLIGKNSEVDLKNTKHLQFIIDTQDKKELINLFYDNLPDNTEFDQVVIDHGSLTQYIKSTEWELAHNPGNRRDTLERNLNKAKMIKMISEYFQINDEFVLPQIISNSDYGRRYYKGVNLQNCHKMLRHACLGNHYQYDLKTAVQAIKLMIAKHIFDQQNEQNWDDFFLATKQYVENRSLVRSTLAEYITTYDESEKLIKTMITAIGFGATTTSPDYHGTAIADIIKNREERTNLLNDEWLQEFIQDQQDLTDFITGYYLNDIDFIESIKDLPDIKLKNRYNKKKVMSYIFQTIEYQIMDQITQLITRSQVLLRVHDAVYTRHKIKAEDMLEIKMYLEELSPYLELDYDTDSQGDIVKQTKFRFTKEYEQESYQHKQLIKKQEQLIKELNK